MAAKTYRQLTLSQVVIVVLAAVAITATVTHQLGRALSPSDHRPVPDSFESEPRVQAMREHLAAAAEQQEIVAKLKKSGYHITYDYLSTPSSDPAPAVKRLADEYGPDLVGKPFYIGTSIRVEHVDLLPQLPSLQIVDFDDMGVTDEDLRYLKGMPNLRVLFLNDTSISGDGIAHLVGTPIETLHLRNCSNIDDSSVRHLSRMQSLKKLYIDDRNMSAAAFRQLELALPNCDVE